MSIYPSRRIDRQKCLNVFFLCSFWYYRIKSEIFILGYNFVLITSQVGFAEFNKTADNRANIGGTIIGAPIVGQ